MSETFEEEGAGAFIPDPEDEEIEQGDTPEVLTLIELERQLGRLEQVAAAKENAPLVPEMFVEADDALQGIAVVLGLSFTGDVQMMVLSALQRYREIKGLR